MPGARLTEAYICGDNGVIDSTTQRAIPSQTIGQQWTVCVRRNTGYYACGKLMNSAQKLETANSMLQKSRSTLGARSA